MTPLPSPVGPTLPAPPTRVKTSTDRAVSPATRRAKRTNPHGRGVNARRSNPSQLNPGGPRRLRPCRCSSASWRQHRWRPPKAIAATPRKDNLDDSDVKGYFTCIAFGRAPTDPGFNRTTCSMRGATRSATSNLTTTVNVSCWQSAPADRAHYWNSSSLAVIPSGSSTQTVCDQNFIRTYRQDGDQDGEGETQPGRG